MLQLWGVCQNNPENEGNIGIMLWNRDDKPFLLKKGKRFCQGIFKKYHKGNETINEFLSRKYKYKALWKTYFEFDEHFKNISVLERLRIYTQIGDGKLFDKYGPMLCLKVEPKLKGINPCDFFICIEDKLVDASISTSQTNQNLSFLTPDLTPNETSLVV